mgnify:CR=1 FL=1
MNRRMSIEHPGKSQCIPSLAVSIVVRDNGRFLLVERANDPGRGMFAFPGGRVENGEDLRKAALRELAEETALIGADLMCLCDLYLPGKDGDFKLHVFLAGGFSGVIAAGDDALSVGWYSLADMAAMPVPQSVLDVARSIIGDD